MRKGIRPPRTKDRNRPADAEDTTGRAAENAGDKETSHEAGPEEPGPGTPSREEVIRTWRQPITNQDEQEKITDDGGGDIPIQDA